MNIIAKLVNDLRRGFSPCPRVRSGHQCHKDSRRYGYECEACGRRGLDYDPDIIKYRDN